MEIVSRLGLIILHDVETSIFRRAGYRETVLDVTFATNHLASRVQDWRVIQEFTSSDHQYITFRVRDGNRQAMGLNVRDPPRWNVDRMDVERLSRAIQRGQPKLMGITDGLPPSEQTEVLEDATMRLMHEACEEAVLRKRFGRGGFRLIGGRLSSRGLGIGA